MTDKVFAWTLFLLILPASAMAAVTDGKITPSKYPCKRKDLQVCKDEMPSNLRHVECASSNGKRYCYYSDDAGVKTSRTVTPIDEE